MGLFDDFLKNAAKSIDNAIWNGSHQFTDLANKAVKAKEEAIGRNENTNVEEKKIENESVTEALPSREVQAEEYGTPKRKISFSLSQDFIYQDADMDFPISFLYKPGGEDWKDYGFNENNINLYLSENMEIGAIVKEYKEKGTALEGKLMKALDEVANTYTETILD